MYPEPTFNQRKDSLIERRTKNAKKSKSMANRKAKRGLQVEKSLNKRSKVCSWSRLINFFAFFNLRKLCRNRTVGVPRALKSAVYAGRYIPATECSWISKIYLAGRGCGWQMRLHPLALLDATQSSIIFLFLSSFTVKKKPVLCEPPLWKNVFEFCGAYFDSISSMSLFFARLMVVGKRQAGSLKRFWDRAALWRDCTLWTSIAGVVLF